MIKTEQFELIPVTFFLREGGRNGPEIQGQRFDKANGTREIYKPLVSEDVPVVGAGEMWGVDASAAPEFDNGNTKIFRVIPVLPLGHVVGAAVILDLQYDPRRGQWQSACQNIGSVRTCYVLDRNSEHKPAGPQEAGRFVCHVTRLISCRFDESGEGAYLVVAVAIDARAVSSRGARRVQHNGQGQAVAMPRIAVA